MKVSLSWLKQYVDIAVPPTEVAERLTMAGSEVKGVQVIGEHWDGIVVGRITAVDPHPNADRLTLVTIDHGRGQEKVVCGAPNVAVDAKVAYGPVGAQLVDPHTGELTTLKSARIRGVLSSGMALSERELGISEDHQGILILPEDAEVGRPLADYLGDAILNVDVTPNRPDCLSMIGIAREIAALTGGEVRLPEAGYPEMEPSVDQQVSVEIVAPDLCPRYCASLITGVAVGESPRWMQERLVSYGMRPINNIVDVTNFVMLEYGQPLHAFDYEKVRGGKIMVRRARQGEVIVSLDDIERTLSSAMLVIADEERAVAVAGVMGGANSEVSQETTSILLEAASFNPRSIHYTGRTLSMPSEACMRFERGVSAGLTMPALKRATKLIAEIGGGQVARGVVDVYPGKREPAPITVSTSDMKRVLGIEFSREQIETTLTALGFDCKSGSSAEEVVATAPDWRSDIALTVDLIEEVARIIGYDSIPTTMLSVPIPRQNPEPLVGLKRVLGRNLVGYGFQEIISHAMVSLESLKKLSPEARLSGRMPLRLVNPMTVEQEYLRPSLRANVLSAVALNKGRLEGGVRLFELGKVYLPGEDGLPGEVEMLCAVLGGPRQAPSWHVPASSSEPELLDFFDAKGIVEALLGQLRVTASFEPAADETLHPTRQAAIVADSGRLGLLGEVHPAVTQAFEIPWPVYLFELGLPALLPVTQSYQMFRPIIRYPAIIRDMALVIDAATPYEKVVDIIQGFPLVERVSLFDVYSGDQVPPGKKSLACHIAYQSPGHTLTDDEVDRVQRKVLDRLSHDLGAVLRS